MIVFKLFQITLGAIGIFQSMVKKKLRKKMITYNNAGAYVFDRTFQIISDKINVTDVLNSPVSESELRVGTKSSYNFIPSSKYFTEQELTEDEMGHEKEYRATKEGVVIRRSFKLN